MKLTEFIDKYFSGTNRKRDLSKCPVCKKSFKEDEKDLVSDHDGNMYHKVCFNKEVENDVLKQKRNDNQLPYDN